MAAETQYTANTGMVVTTDIGNAKDIHPKNKQDVAKRLASIALNDVYGKKQVCSGPSSCDGTSPWTLPDGR